MCGLRPSSKAEAQKRIDALASFLPDSTPARRRLTRDASFANRPRAHDAQRQSAETLSAPARTDTLTPAFARVSSPTGTAATSKTARHLALQTASKPRGSSYTDSPDPPARRGRRTPSAHLREPHRVHERAPTPLAQTTRRRRGRSRSCFLQIPPLCAPPPSAHLRIPASDLCASNAVGRPPGADWLQACFTSSTPRAAPPQLCALPHRICRIYPPSNAVGARRFSHSRPPRMSSRRCETPPHPARPEKVSAPAHIDRARRSPQLWRTSTTRRTVQTLRTRAGPHPGLLTAPHAAHHRRASTSHPASNPAAVGTPPPLDTWALARNRSPARTRSGSADRSLLRRSTSQNLRASSAHRPLAAANAPTMSVLPIRQRHAYPLCPAKTLVDVCDAFADLGMKKSNEQQNVTKTMRGRRKERERDIYGEGEGEEGDGNKGRGDKERESTESAEDEGRCGISKGNAKVREHREGRGKEKNTDGDGVFEEVPYLLQLEADLEDGPRLACEKSSASVENGKGKRDKNEKVRMRTPQGKGTSMKETQGNRMEGQRVRRPHTRNATVKGKKSWRRTPLLAHGSHGAKKMEPAAVVPRRAEESKNRKMREWDVKGHTTPSADDPGGAADQGRARGLPAQEKARKHHHETSMHAPRGKIGVRPILRDVSARWAVCPRRASRAAYVAAVGVVRGRAGGAWTVQVEEAGVGAQSSSAGVEDWGARRLARPADAIEAASGMGLMGLDPEKGGGAGV
ncbi:hypothetical protein C8R47DRAFT_1262478 [Mycena vitilis]|nr:hypothetical protein C8R47DRAFT_1262478 [Mycena vitilis]